MRDLTNLIKEAKKRGVTDHGILNLIREYLQVLILKAIYQSKYGGGLCFMGGTCLRICHDLKRYSEDLDFTLDKKIQNYSFDELNGIIVSFLENTDFDVDVHVSEEKVVQKSFIRVGKILHTFGLSSLKSQKIHVKLEVDTNPVSIGSGEMESFFVAKFNEMFPILKHTDDTLFSGKICAVLNREYTKGRDFYDLLWYLNRKQAINLGFINRAFKQAKKKLHFKDSQDVLQALTEKVESVKIEDIMKDMGRFLEDPTEEVVIRHYHAAFRQAVVRYS